MKSHIPISIVHIASGDLWAGAEVQLFTLVKTLHGFEDVSVQVILLNHGELENRLQTSNIPVEVFDESQLNSIKIMWQLFKSLKSKRPHLVHTHRIKENTLGGIAARLAGNIPSLRTVHGAQEHQAGWRKPHKLILHTLDWLIGRYLQRRIIAVSSDLAKLLCHDYLADRIAIIENGIDIDAIAPFSSDKVPRSIPYNKGPAKIGLVGRLVPVKRVDLFIKIAHHLKRYHPNRSVRFHIFGDGPMRAELEALRAELDLEEIVQFEGHCDDIYKKIASLDALVITSDHEGLPMTLLEAMALGIPIISHSVGGIPQVLGNGKYGHLISTQTISEYSSAIIDILNNTDKTTSLIVAAKQHVRDSYTSQHNANQYVKLYQSILMEK